MQFPECGTSRRSKTISLAIAVVMGLAILGVAGCSSKSSTTTTAAPPSASPSEKSTSQGKFTLGSPDIAPGVQIPLEFSSYGSNTSPELTWTSLPAGTKDMALVMIDRMDDGFEFIHWVVYGISPTDKGFPRNAVPAGAVQGANTTGQAKYYGPEPPPGETHTYKFTLYALSSKLDLRPGADWATVKSAMEGKVLGQAELSAPFKSP